MLMVVQATKTIQTISSWSLSWSKYGSDMTMIYNDYIFLHIPLHLWVSPKISRHLLCFLAILLVLMGSQWFNGRSLCHCIPHLPIPPGSRGTSDYLRSSGMTVVSSAGVRVPLLGERQQIPDWERFCINKSIEGCGKWSPSSSKLIKRSSKRLWPRTKSIEVRDVNLPCRSAYHIFIVAPKPSKSLLVKSLYQHGSGDCAVGTWF